MRGSCRVLLLPCFLPGCASILRGTDGEIHVRSDPEGARLDVVGRGPVITNIVGPGLAVTEIPPNISFTATTPAERVLPKREDWTVYVSKPGYRPAVFQVFK